MDIIVAILGLAITGLIVGALGRLVVPGPNPMGIGATILIGLAGAFLGFIVAVLLSVDSAIVVLILEVLGAALITYALSRRRVIR